MHEQVVSTIRWRATWGRDQTSTEGWTSQGHCIHPCISHSAVNTAGTQVIIPLLPNYTYFLVCRNKGIQVHGPSVWGSEQDTLNSAVGSTPPVSHHHPSLIGNKWSYFHPRLQGYFCYSWIRTGGALYPLTTPHSPDNFPRMRHMPKIIKLNHGQPGLQISCCLAQRPFCDTHSTSQGPDHLWVSWRLKTLKIPSGDSPSTESKYCNWRKRLDGVGEGRSTGA